MRLVWGEFSAIPPCLTFTCQISGVKAWDGIAVTRTSSRNLTREANGMNQPVDINMNEEVSKFSPITIKVKRNIRRLRLQKGYSMNEGASLLGVSRKQLEDIETVRNYGCHLDLELLAKIKVIYGISMDEIFGELPSDYYSDYYIRPRKKL